MRVRNPAAAIALLAAPLLVSFPALADCAPGEWFCDDAQKKPEAEAPPAEPPRDEKTPRPPPAKNETSPPAAAVDGSEPWPPVVHEPSHKLKTATPSQEPEPTKRFGINGHGNFALGGSDPYYDAPSMQGPGGAFRFRPMEMIGIDSGLELAAGRDWNGEDRVETALLFHALLFVTPANRVELHALAGFGLSLAYVEEEEPGDDPIRHYWYLGWDFGFGFEWYLTKRVTLGVEALALMRARENKGKNNPEFVDPGSHRATNVSVGGLVRPGVTYYF